MQNKVIITGVLASALFIGGVVGCSAFDKVDKVEAPITDHDNHWEIVDKRRGIRGGI